MKYFRWLNAAVTRNLRSIEMVGVLMRIFSFSLVSWLGPESPFLFVWAFNTVDAVMLSWCAIIKKDKAYTTLDGRGGSGLYANVNQWLNAYQLTDALVAPKPETPRRATPSPNSKPRKLSFREQQEWDQMESLILTAEKTVAERHQAVQDATKQGHVALADACHALEAAERAVAAHYARWQELEARRTAT